MMRRQVWTAWVAVAVTVLALSFIGLRGAAPSTDNTSIRQDDEQMQTDEAIRAKIEKRLLMDDRIAWELLQVEVNQGHAILYGEVRTPQEKGLASLIASTVPGVKGLTNSIIVEPAVTKDHKLAKAIWNVLRGVPVLSGNGTLKVNVKNAVVKLEGVVECSIEKEAAEKAVASVPGVATVINCQGTMTMLGGSVIRPELEAVMAQAGRHFVSRAFLDVYTHKGKVVIAKEPAVRRNGKLADDPGGDQPAGSGLSPPEGSAAAGAGLSTDSS